MRERQGAEIKIVAVEAPGRLTPSPPDFGLGDLGCDRGDDAGRHLVLQLEDICERTIEAIRPQMRP
jgi:hypothetical protein